MAQKNRTKEIWLIPKRVNLHQTVCLIDGIKERGYLPRSLRVRYSSSSKLWNRTL